MEAEGAHLTLQRDQPLGGQLGAAMFAETGVHDLEVGEEGGGIRVTLGPRRVTARCREAMVNKAAKTPVGFALRQVSKCCRGFRKLLEIALQGGRERRRVGGSAGRDVV